MSEALRRYVELRKDALDRLPAETRNRLFRLIGEDICDDWS
jgi:hypothetical protein